MNPGLARLCTADEMSCFEFGVPATHLNPTVHPSPEAKRHDAPRRCLNWCSHAALYTPTFPTDIMMTEFALHHITGCIEVIQKLLDSVFWDK